MSPSNPIANDPLRELRVWHRFHIRLLAVYGGTVLVVLVVMGVWFFRVGVNTEIEGLQKRLRAVVTSLAETIDVDPIAEIAIDATEMTETHNALSEQFNRIPSTQSI